ncbi:MAG: oligosaccharide flippase family protein [Phycisphaerales bacterium]
MRASAWTVGGYVFSLGMRLVSNVLLTRLLAPELFGIMLFAQSLLEGLALFSELGVGQSLIRDPRGEERAFVNTAWTMQVVRGAILTVIACAAAWPMAVVYDAPILLGVIPAMGAVSLLAGLFSPSYHLMYRHLTLGRVMALDQSSALLGTATAILLAWLTGSVWALVIANLSSVGWKAVWTHWLLPGPRVRPQWDPGAARAIWGFGRWILLSSAMMFVSRKADAFMLPRLIGFQMLGVYNIAMALAEITVSFGAQITSSVLFPAYSRVAHEGVDRLRDVYYRSRLRIDILCLFTTGGICGGAPWIIRFLYDDRYAMASVMLSALAVRSAMMAMLLPAESVLFAMGHSWYSFTRNAARAVWVIAGIPIAWAVGSHLPDPNGGLYGVLVVMALTEVPVLLVLWPAAIKHRVFWLPGELRSVLLFAVGLLAGYLFLTIVPQVRLNDVFQAMGWTPQQSRGTP